MIIMAENERFNRKRNRLKEFDYSGFHSYFITICTANKQPYFIEGNVVKEIIIELGNEANSFGFQVYSYCFMPDHLHLLLIGKENSKLIEFIKAFKQKTGYLFKQKTKCSGNVIMSGLGKVKMSGFGQ